MPDEAGLVFVDRLGVPAPPRPDVPSRTLLVGVPERTRARLAELGAHDLVGNDDSGDVDLVVVSTRMPRGDVVPLLPSLRERGGAIVALVHTGGEGLAVEIMRSGGAGVVAEGNEEALHAFVSGAEHETGLLETYDRQLAQARGGTDALRARDPISRLPTRPAFDQRLVELTQSGDVPRVAFVRLLHLAGASRLQGPSGMPAEPRVVIEAAALVRRRLAIQFRQLAQHYGVELFALGPADFGLLGADLSPHGAEELGSRLGALVGRFAPNGHHPLTLAMGHAGAEVTQEVATLRELAQRALEVALAEKDGAVVSADTLSLGVSSTTELEAATRMIAYVEQHGPHGAGHGARVAEIAGEVAWQLGYEGQARSRIQLAALLADIGLVGMPTEVLAGPEGLDGELLEAYRSHPVRGAEYLRVSAGEEVAEAVRSHHERWDGAGYPDGLEGETVPVAARIIAVAAAAERLRADGAALGDPEYAAAALAELAGSELDPNLVAHATALVAPDGDREPVGAGAR